MLSNPIKWSLTGIGGLAATLMFLAIIPIQQWNSGSPSSTETSTGTSTRSVTTYDIGVNGMSSTRNGETTHSPYGDMEGTLPDAASAARGLIIFATILLVVSLMMLLNAERIAPRLPDPILALVLPLVLAFLAFIFEMSAWANWAEEVGDDDIPYGAQFAFAIVAWLLILAFNLLLAFAIFQAKQASAEGDQTQVVVAEVVVMQPVTQTQVVPMQPVPQAPTMQPVLIPKDEAPQDTGGFCGACGQARAACTCGAAVTVGFCGACGQARGTCSCDPSGGAATASGDGAIVGVPLSQ